MWVIARNIEHPAWSEPSAGEAEATQEDVAASRDKDTMHRKPRRLKDAANQNTLENRDPRKWKVPMSASLAQVPRLGFPAFPCLLRRSENQRLINLEVSRTRDAFYQKAHHPK